MAEAKVLSVRVPEELAAWLDEYAKERGVSRTDLLASALASFREDAKAGVPDLRTKIAEVRAASRSATLAALQGIGNCPKRPGELGHVWGSHKTHPNRPCTFCGLYGRAGHDPSKSPEEQEGFFAQATRERVELFAQLKAPNSVKGIPSSNARS